MNRRISRTRAQVAVSLAACLVLVPFAHAQQPAPAAAPATTSAAAGEKTFSQKDLDEIMAPIALYPDALLAQVLMASTYPLQVIEAHRWVQANATLKGKDLEDALQKQTWDPAVKALAVLPQVLTMMSEKLDWTQKLGNAFLAQQSDVMDTAQKLRMKAQEAGNLKSSPEQTVKTEKQAEKTVVIIESAKPETVYVPTYNPATVYGTWWYPYPPPYYYYPPGYAYGYGAGWAFATGVVVGAAIWGGCGWGNNEININRNNYNNFNRTNNASPKFEHNAANRKGVAYGDKATSQKFNRGGDAATAKWREQFRGRAEQGRRDMQGMDRGQLQNQVSAADRQARSGGASASQRGSGDLGSRGSGGASASQRGSSDFGGRGSSGASASQRGNTGGFSGAGGGGASTRAASSRGSSSMGSRGGGGGRGGGGRR